MRRGYRGAMVPDDRPSPTFSAYVRTAFAPRMLLMLLVFLAVGIVCARLGVWQIDRAQARGALAAEHARDELLLDRPVELGDVLVPQRSFPGNQVGKQVRVTGEFEPDGQLFVEGRVLDGELGYLVLTPLRVGDDGSDGASWATLSGQPVLPVVRGWVPAADLAGYAPPSGPIEVTGFLQASESVNLGLVADGITDSVSSGDLVNRWGGPIYSGYLVQESSDPIGDASIAALPRPVVEGGAGLDMQNLFYAIQWWVFGAFALVLWGRMVRDEAYGGAKDGFEGWEALQPGV